MKNKFLILMLFSVLLSFSSCKCKKEVTETRIFNPNNYTYYDGVAWVQLSDPGLFSKNYLGIVCIDEMGNELFSMPDVNKDDVSNFYDNMALVKGQYIINKNGEITHDLVDEFDLENVEIFPDNYFDGFIIVEKDVNGVLRTGILNSKLKWVVKPTAKFNDIEPLGNFLYYNDTIGYFDAKKNKFISEAEYKSKHIQRCFQKNGVIFLSQDNGNNFKYHSFLTGGTIELDDNCRTGFYNRDLEMVLDLSFYKDLIVLSDFKDDKCLVRFKTMQKRYIADIALDNIIIGLINIKGEFIFLKSVISDYVGYNNEKIEFKGCYYDWDGNYYTKETDE